MATLLIDTSKFSERVDVSDHIADKYLDRHILTAQERYLKPLLGAAFYNELLEDKLSGYYGTGIEALIDDYITPYLVWRSYQVYLPHSKTFMTGMGPRVLTEDNSMPLSDKHLSIMRDESKSMADFYERELYEYLCDNKETFTTWEDATDKNRNVYLPGITGVGRNSRNDNIKDGSISYDKESD